MTDYDTLLLGTAQTSVFLRELDKFKFNPSGIQRVVLDHLAQVTEGKVDIVDPTNPFVFSLESAAVNTTNFIIQNTVNTRRQYPALAQTEDDIYLHMSDVDFVDRFASPAKTTFSVMVEKEELIAALVPVPGTNFKKLTIPRNTEFKIADTVFSLQYPVDIIQYQHGGFQILYVNDKPSPLYELSSNVVQWDMRKSSQTKQDWLYLDLIVHQFKIETYSSAISGATGFKQNYEFKDSFYFARVYNKSSDTGNLWKEILTTHTDQVYDHNTPTAVLRVTEGNLSVSIPQVYLSSNKVKGKIRVDIYETKGSVNMILENYLSSAFETEWRLIDTDESNAYIAPLGTLKTIFGFSRYPVVGGKNALTFTELRQRVINNSIGPQQIPITNVQIESSLSNRGFSVIKNVDVVTNRIFLASKALPVPFDERLITAGSASVETVVSSISELRSHSLVKNNSTRTTLVPELVYKFNNGITTLVSSVDLTNLMTATPEQRAEYLNKGRYFYTPFHYVLDTGADEFEIRPYYLDSPEVRSVSFIEQNTVSGLQINTVSYSLTRTTQGFSLRIVTEANDSTKLISNSNIRCYLSFTPENESSRCFILATVTRDTNNNFVFTFNLESNFDIDSEDVLNLTSFKMLDYANRSLGTPLLKDFDLIFSTTEFPLGTASSNIDNVLVYLPKSFDNINNPLSVSGIGITHEKIKLFFGYALKTLWSRSRSVLASTPYRTYTTSSIKVYDKDVYVPDPITGAIFKVLPSGELSYNILHRAGDQVRNEFGELVYDYKVGDIMKDADGKPIPADPVGIVRQIDLTFIDAAYYFATDPASSSYRKQMVDSMLTWIVDDIADISNKLLEQTRIYFYPKTNMGTVKVLADNAVVTNIEAAQFFNVRIYVNNTTFNNTLLKSTLTKSTIRTIDTALQSSVISISELTIKLMEIYGNDAISVTVDGLGGSSNIQTVTMLNENERCSIRKKLVSLPNNVLIVEEDVNISFILHELT